ncbi:hypothetical protein BpHYR1_051966 [Brachionus plicatilis]|uniref:Uncharacterized protein n=1 Tax=Brachionus plicatilis TaxID=10195 RepID=A0A3M7SCT2_BRAPC|nr:hypothetical protein BpHYR1_051966 [Brachionus plicatilis]
MISCSIIIRSDFRNSIFIFSTFQYSLSDLFLGPVYCHLPLGRRFPQNQLSFSGDVSFSDSSSSSSSLIIKFKSFSHSKNSRDDLVRESKDNESFFEAFGN